MTIPAGKEAEQRAKALVKCEQSKCVYMCVFVYSNNKCMHARKMWAELCTAKDEIVSIVKPLNDR